MNTTINNDYKEQELSWKPTIHVKHNQDKQKWIISLENILKFSFIKRSENTLDYIYSINPDKADSVFKILYACKICKEFLSGKIKANDKIIAEYTSTTKNKRDEKSLEYLIEYWNKVYELEKLLNQKFSPAEITKNFDKESFDFYRLERCLLDKKPYRIDDFHLKEITLNGLNENYINEFKTKKSYDFAFKEKETITFANQQFEFYKVKALFNVIIKDVEISEKTPPIMLIKILVDNNNDEMYLSEQIFLNEKDTFAIINPENLEYLKTATPL